MSAPDPIAIRPYDAATDAEALRALFIALQDHEHALEPLAPTGAEIADTYLAWMFECCAENDGRVLVAVSEGKLIGFLTVQLAVRRSDPDDPVLVHALVSELMVQGRWRNRGLGARLLAAAEALARGAGRAEIRVGVVARNLGARRFYAREGYDELFLYLHKPLDGG